MSDTTETEIPRRYAFVEIMGHRSHWGEISEVEFAGAKFLRVHDVDTDEVHNYGGAAIFNVSEISRAKLDAHIEQQVRYKREQTEREARWKAQDEAIRKARELPAPKPEPTEISDADGEWVDDAEDPEKSHLCLTANYYDNPERVFLALELAGEPIDTTQETVARWTSEQRKAAAEWALSRSYAASDNDDVIVPPRPDFIELLF